MPSYFGLVAIMLLVASSVARTQTFTTIAIRPSASTDRSATTLQITPDGDLTGHAVPVFELLSLAYDVPDNPSPRLTSLPDWAYGQSFDIDAKAPASLRLASKDIATQKKTIQQLVRGLLADRFGLVLNVKMERVQVYALRVAKRGSMLTRSQVTSADCTMDFSPEGCHNFASGFGHPLNGNAVDMADLAGYLENWADLPVVNHTGLDGLFTMHSQGWKPMKLPPPPPGAAATGTEFVSLPSLAAVLSEFGLELVEERDSVAFYVVERIHQPNTK